ncbi:hypothetical protein [Streptosporangium roseum]|uniref:hypothetical protein n=1 Tax=Streptosporangium roseum TaxID=2001 RepID=UPI0011D23F8C|nr:hypothetical protein [Streptosporangium roseum]
MSEWLLEYAAGGPRPVTVAAPHGTRVRLLAEAELARRGWRPAGTPAVADLLVVCGSPEDALTRAVETVWADTPCPRARVELREDLWPEQVAGALDGAASRLADGPAQRRDAAERVRHQSRRDRGRTHGHDVDGPGRGNGDGWQEHGDGHDVDGPGHGNGHGHGHGDRDGDGHAHGHGDGMDGPGGLRMAGRGPDRDGLTLDRLHVPLGPVLPDWPAGLVVETVLQGDVIQRARVRISGGSGVERFWDAPWLAALAGRHVTRGEAARRRAASHLDSLGRLLAVSGWDSSATRARRLRDRLLWERPDDGLAEDFTRFARRVRRSRPLRWMLRGLGTVDASYGPAVRVRGDVVARMERWLAGTEAALGDLDDRSRLADDEGPRGPVGERLSESLLAVLPTLLAGAELATARLIVASLDPDLDQVPSAYGALHA